MVRLLSFPLLLPAPAPSQPLPSIFVMTFSLCFSCQLLYLASSLYQPQDLRYQDYMETDVLNVADLPNYFIAQNYF